VTSADEARRFLHEMPIHQSKLSMQNEPFRESRPRLEIELMGKEPLQRMELALKAAKAGTWEWVLDSDRHDWSDSVWTLYGLVPGQCEPTDRTWLTVIHPDDRDRVTRTIQGAAAAGQAIEIIWRVNLPAGEPERWLMLRGGPVMGAAGKPDRYLGIVIDMTERKRAQTARDENETRLRLFIEHAPAALAMFDSKMRYLAVSRGWLDDFGLGGRNIIGRCHYEIFPEIPPRWREAHRRGLAGEVIRAAEDPFERSDGIVQWVRWEVRPWHQGDGTVGGIVILSEDITQRKRAEAVLRDADRRKDEFLAMLAHELRNPLAPIRNAAHILGLLDTAGPQVRWAQNVIEQQVNHLTRLVDDMLEVSRIIRGKITLKPDTIDFNALATRVIADMRPLIDAKGHQLHLELPPESLWLRGDLVRLSQVLVNLIENAIKYTPDHGSIRLSANPGKDEIEVVVEDNGMGIAADLLPHVFDLFQQGERTLDRAEGGLGLGLSLVRSLVQAHGGRVIAESHGQGCGTRMRLWLPRSSTTPASQPESSVERPGSDTNPTPRRILVVDDEEAVANSTALLLTLAGNLVQVARSGPEAIQIVRVFQPEVVLLDIGLGSMNGYEVAHELRAGPGGQALCLIAVSGYGDAKSQERARTAGFDHYLIKPVEPGQLQELLVVLKAGPTWAE
jgi:PAS domain S-box-containing protein